MSIFHVFTVDSTFVDTHTSMRFDQLDLCEVNTDMAPCILSTDM
jgi:hypothetical protein